MRTRTGIAALLAAAATTLTGCTVTVTGRAADPGSAVPKSDLAIVGDSGDAFDQLVKNGLTDAMAFWRKVYPSVSGGKPLPELRGKLYSVAVPNLVTAVKENGCIKQGGLAAVAANAKYCRLDDSILWDRNPRDLVPALSAKYGPLLVAMVFAHEFGHAVQARLGLFAAVHTPADQVHLETQADCAAGAFTATVMQGQQPHVKATPAEFERALLGFLAVRDGTPVDERDISHGDGFDRLAALSTGFHSGVTACYAPGWGDRVITERPYAPGEEQQSRGGNESLDEVVSGRGGLQPDLNTFWKAQFQRIGKQWSDVKFTQSDHPACGDTSSSFGYCPDDNTVYFSNQFAQLAYNSIATLDVNQRTFVTTVVENQPGDFALGTLFAYGWGFAVQHQLHPDRRLDDAPALLATSCYAGAYSKYVNVAPNTPGHRFWLSPPDVDEATSAVMMLVGTDAAFGSRGTTSLDRVSALVKGYERGLGAC